MTSKPLRAPVAPLRSASSDDEKKAAAAAAAAPRKVSRHDQCSPVPASGSRSAAERPAWSAPAAVAEPAKKEVLS